MSWDFKAYMTEGHKHLALQKYYHRRDQDSRDFVNKVGTVLDELLLNAHFKKDTAVPHTRGPMHGSCINQSHKLRPG